MSLYDQHLPEGKFKFDESVTACFDNMLERSIPAYPAMRQLTHEYADTFIKPGSTVVDIGVSLGQAIAPLIHANPEAHFIGIDVSWPMLAECRKRFEKEIKAGQVRITYRDLRKEFPDVSADAILSVLTLQFTPIEYRQQILKNIYNALAPGGAFLLVEKVLGEGHEINTLMNDVYYAMKGANGYTAEEIQRKKMALEGVLVPLTAQMNEDLLNRTGFRFIDCYWRHGNFAAWLAVK